MNKQDTISFIQKRFKSASFEELPFLISWHEDDPRAGVQALIVSAQKRIAKYENKVAHTDQMYALQEKLERQGSSIVVGIDEVGRGSIAGPLTVAAVALPSSAHIVGLDDSKKLSPKRREELARVIKEKALLLGIAHVSPAEIDRCGMGLCVKTAMKAALRNAGIQESDTDASVLVDGIPVHIHPREKAIVGGDATQACIAAASIFAKVTRDAMMIKYDDKYPGYDFAHSKGYGSAKHIAAVREHGLCDIHRKSFCRNFVN